jgi:uncharacterized protein
VRIVLDANVVAAGVCWQGEGYLCFVKLARRQATAFGTILTIEETRETVTRLIREKRPEHNATARLNWYLENCRLVEPAPLGKQRSRDRDDDLYLSAALSASADCIVTYDKDLLALQKPFGIEILRPASFLKRLLA